jgi:hypothetical protein
VGRPPGKQERRVPMLQQLAGSDLGAACRCCFAGAHDAAMDGGSRGLRTPGRPVLTGADKGPPVGSVRGAGCAAQHTSSSQEMCPQSAA